VGGTDALERPGHLIDRANSGEPIRDPRSVDVRREDVLDRGRDLAGEADLPHRSTNSTELERPEPEKGDEALAVPAVADHVVEARERLADDLDALVLLGLERVVGEVGREVRVDLLVREPGARVELRQELPA